MTLLRDVIDIPEEVHASDFVLSLTDGVAHVDETVRQYVVTPALANAFDQALGLVESAVTSGGSQAAFLHGSFGSGKSHFMAVLHAILGGNAAARGIPELAPTIARHDGALQGRKFLRLAYHLIGARSLEGALFLGYLDQVRRLHPDASLPALHQTDGLLGDAERLRVRLGDEAFFGGLNGGTGGTGYWGAFAGGWNLERYQLARLASPDDPERRQLVDALARTYFQAYAQSAEYVDIDTGLRVIAEHGASLGYSGVVLFLDELVLWLATRVADPDWVASEGSKVAKLVESADARRPIPLISFIARQRDLRDFLGDTAPGAEQAAIADTFRWWEDRFDRITLGDANLPFVASKRLLQPRSPEAKRVLDEAFAHLDRRPDVWNTLLDGISSDPQHRGADEAAFRLTYPFSSALVSALRALSSLMQRDRTALKVMQQILVDQRDELEVNDLVPAGDVFDYVVEGNQALDAAMERHFAAARRLYHERFEPVLQRDHHLTAEEAERQGRRAPYGVDDRLAKTLLLAGLVPQVSALRDLDAGRLAALNHGTIRSPLPGQESTTVLTKLRQWQPQVPEIKLSGDGRNPTVAIQLADVDYQSILDRVRNEDNAGTRRRLLRELVWSAFGIPYDPNLFRRQEYPLVWRGSRRYVDLAYGNVVDTSDVPDEILWHGDERWRVVIDYPFDEDSGRSPVDDLARVDDLTQRAGAARTIVWLPRFLSGDRLRDLGRLVQLNYLFGGDGSRFDANADHLSVTDRGQARAILQTMRDSLHQLLLGVLQQAYGAQAPNPGDVEIAQGHDRVLASLDRGLAVQEPVGATLKLAFENLLDQLLRYSYPAHPAFEPSGSELRPAELRLALQFVERARQEPNGRVPVGNSPERSTLRRVCNPLGLGEMLENTYVLDEGTNFPWRNRFTQAMGRDHVVGTVTVGQLRGWLDADAVRGLTPAVGNLVIASWAVIADRAWYRHGGPLGRTPALEQVSDDMELREQQLPSEQVWRTAGRRASTLLGAKPAGFLSGRQLTAFATEVRNRASGLETEASRLEQVLRNHAGDLGLDLTAATGRLATAAASVRLLGEIKRAHRDSDVIDVVAGALLPAEDHIVARSMTEAGNVVHAVTNTPWELIRALREVNDDRRDEAQEILRRLKEASEVDEFQQGLPDAVHQAWAAASAVLTTTVIPPGQPVTPPSAAEPDSQIVDAGDLNPALSALRQFADKHPEARIRVSWRIEP